MSAPTIHLDTNYLVYYTNSDNEEIIERFNVWQRGGSKIYISAMVWAEFQCGPLSVREHDLAHDVVHGILPLTLEIGSRAGSLFRATGRRSRSLPDCIIAATAISERVPLATMNLADFEPFVAHGLQLL
jgi:predicted nucleic acid-binding protein